MRDRSQELLVSTVLALLNALLRYVAFCCFRRRPGPVKCIVAFRSSAIGDFICCLPALNYLRRTYPDAKIHLVTTATANRKFRRDPRFVAGATVLADPRIIDRVHLLDNTRITSLGYVRQMRSSLRQLAPDRVFLLPMTGATLSGQLKKMLFLWVLGLDRNVSGYALHQMRILRDTQYRMGLWIHQVRAAMRAAGASQSEAVEFGISRPADVRASVDTLWRDSGLNGAEVAALFAGAKFAHRRWPIEHFATLSKRILECHDIRIVLVGGPEDSAFGQQLQSMDVPLLNLAGKFTLLETAEILRRCKVLIGNESGPVHLAAAVGTPTVSITSGIPYPGVWEPWGSRNITIRNRVNCEYCFSEDHCPRGTMECIRGITVDDVWRVVPAVLGARPHAKMGLQS